MQPVAPISPAVVSQERSQEDRWRELHDLIVRGTLHPERLTPVEVSEVSGIALLSITASARPDEKGVEDG